MCRIYEEVIVIAVSVDIDRRLATTRSRVFENIDRFDMERLSISGSNVCFLVMCVIRACLSSGGTVPDISELVYIFVDERTLQMQVRA